MSHRDIIELLPWYVNGTLQEEERRSVEVHLAACRECALEFEQLNKLQTAVRELSAQAPAPSPASLHQVLARMDDYERDKRRAHDKRFGAFTRWWDALRGRWWEPTPSFARVVIAAQLLLIVALGGLVVSRHELDRGGQTASGPGAETRQNTTKLVVGFQEGISEQKVRETILKIQGRIVDGPSAIGAYTIEVPVAPQRAWEIDKLLQNLRQDQHVIRFAARKL